MMIAVPTISGPLILTDRRVSTFSSSLVGVPRETIGPGDPDNRMSVALSESSAGDFLLTISGRSPLQHTGETQLHITLEQAYSFEESVRAIFQAAREEGILPR